MGDSGNSVLLNALDQTLDENVLTALRFRTMKNMIERAVPRAAKDSGDFIVNGNKLQEIMRDNSGTIERLFPADVKEKLEILADLSGRTFEELKPKTGGREIAKALGSRAVISGGGLAAGKSAVVEPMSFFLTFSLMNPDSVFFRALTNEGSPLVNEIIKFGTRAGVRKGAENE